MLAQDPLADSMLKDVRLDLVRRRPPGALEVGVAPDRRQLRRSVERHPAHQLRRHVVLGVSTGLPDPLVGVLPDLGRALGLRLHDRPQASRQALGAARMEQDRVERRAVDVVLALVVGAVADAHRTGAGVPGEVVARRLGQVASAVDPIHDLEGSVVVGLQIGDELHELVGFPIEVQVVQRLEGEGRVAQPRVAVVPVALAARGFRKGGGERRDGRTGRDIREPLDRQRRALDRIAPAVVREPRPSQPAPPVATCRGDPCVRLVDVARRG